MTAISERKTKKTVGSDENILSMYLNEINRIPLLSREEEEKTARESAAGNKAAREKLLNANLRFVVTVAKKYQGQGLPLEDLISEGNSGLINAVDRFNVEMGYRFISYAVWWIRQAMLNALGEKSRMIRLPQNRVMELIQIENARKMVQNQHSFEEEIKEIANLLNMDKDHVIELINISKGMLSLEYSISDDRDTPLGDFIEDNQNATPYQNAEKSVLERDIKNVLSTLEKNEAEVIRCHYGLDQRPAMTLQEIGERFQLSKERIRQIEEKAITRLRNPLRKDKLRVYVA